jgi:hypothetical protein
MQSAHPADPADDVITGPAEPASAEARTPEAAAAAATGEVATAEPVSAEEAAAGAGPAEAEQAGAELADTDLAESAPAAEAELAEEAGATEVDQPDASAADSAVAEPEVAVAEESPAGIGAAGAEPTVTAASEPAAEPKPAQPETTTAAADETTAAADETTPTANETTLAADEPAKPGPARPEPGKNGSTQSQVAGTGAGTGSFVVRPGSPVGYIPPAPAPPARPQSAYRRDDPAARPSGKAESWPRVIWNTVWLPVRRRAAAHKSRWLIAVAVLLAGVVIAVFVLVSGSGPAARPAPGNSATGNSATGNSGGGQAIATAGAARAAASSWVVAEVGRAGVVACDPVTCGALQSAGMPASNLVQLGPSAADTLGSAVVVATPALRAQLGTRLATVYAPVVLARFGTGPDQVQVRVTAPDGGPAYLRGLRADVRGRTATGASLLRNTNVTAAAAARQRLAAGQVDSRMLIMLSGLAYQQPVRIAAFSDSGPGASPGVPLRQAELATPRTGPAAGPALNSMLNFIRAQRAPYKAAHASLVKLASGQSVVRIVFAAPSPLGLLPVPQAAQ